MNMSNKYNYYNSHNLRSQSLDLMRFPLAIIIIIVHTFSQNLILHGEVYSYENMPLLTIINNIIDVFFREQSVPIYYFISGYVFFLGGEFSYSKYNDKLKNRLKTLLIPYIVWNIISVISALLMFLPIFRSFVPNIHTIELNFDIQSILQCFWDNSNSIFTQTENPIWAKISPHNYALWFIRDLMIVVVSTPIIYSLIRKTKYYLLIVLFTLWFFIGKHSEYGRFDQLLSAFSFFYLGAYFSINNKDMIQIFNNLFSKSIILYIVFGIGCIFSKLYVPDYFYYFKRINIVIGLFLAYNISTRLIIKNICKVNRHLSQSSYFIYLSHALICTSILKLQFIILKPSNDISIVLIYISTVIITTITLLILNHILIKKTPTIYRLLTGKK